MNEALHLIILATSGWALVDAKTIGVKLIILATSGWVLVDAKTIGVKKGQIKGAGNLGPWGWFFACLLLWVISFPFYLAKRPEFKRINGK